MRNLVIAALFLSACSAQDPSDDDKKGNNGSANNGQTSGTIASNNVNNGETNGNNQTVGNNGQTNTGNNGQTSSLGDVPDAITSAGAAFGGTLAPGESVSVDLTVFQSDRVTMWLRQANGTSWDASINIFRDGVAEPLVYGNPRGDADASIPFRESELEDGYEFWFTGTYSMQLENRGNTAGDFEFTLECRGGPCAAVSGDWDVDGTPDSSDDCPYRPDDCSPLYNGLSNGQLEDAIRADHANHNMMNYVEARVHMFAWIDNRNGEVEGVYTGDSVATVEIPDAAQMNTEHGWPQSRSGGDEATESDLHHLFPTKPDANTERASLYYGEVVNPEWQRGGSARGRNAAGDTVFEPRDSHKGAAARALFYYAVIYDQNMRPEEEAVLRQWNETYPPSETEQQRNQSIFNVQRSRNPFVDDPALADRISDF